MIGFPNRACVVASWPCLRRSSWAARRWVSPVGWVADDYGPRRTLGMAAAFGLAAYWSGCSSWPGTGFVSSAHVNGAHYGSPVVRMIFQGPGFDAIFCLPRQCREVCSLFLTEKTWRHAWGRRRSGDSDSTIHDAAPTRLWARKIIGHFLPNRAEISAAGTGLLK